MQGRRQRTYPLEKPLLIRPTRSLPTQSIAVTASSLPSAYVQTLRRGYALATGAARTRAVRLPAEAIYKERHTGQKRYLRACGAARSTSGRLGTPHSACHPILSYKNRVASHQTGATPHALLTVESSRPEKRGLRGMEPCPHAPDRPRGPPLST